jgi:hypothetical protein
MKTDALWQMVMGLLRPSLKSTGVRLELMSNEELDHWLEDHHRA